MNREISGKNVTLFMVDGRAIQAKDVYLAVDSTVGYTVESQKFIFATRDVRSVQLRTASRKAYGVLVGVGLGAVVGVATAGKGNCRAEDGRFCTSQAELQTYGAAIFGSIFGSLGFLLAPGPVVKTYMSLQGSND